MSTSTISRLPDTGRLSDSKAKRVTFFETRDYIDSMPRREDWLQGKRGKQFRAAFTVLRYLAEHALYDKCSDQQYGNVTADKCWRDVIAAETMLSSHAVSDALSALGEQDLILRWRGGRRAQKADRISVRPLLNKVRISKRQQVDESRAFEYGAEPKPGLMFLRSCYKFQLGRSKSHPSQNGYAPYTTWTVWCREFPEGSSHQWYPSNDDKRPGQFYAEDWTDKHISHDDKFYYADQF